MNSVILSWRPANIASITIMAVVIIFVAGLVMQGYRQFGGAS